MKVGFIQYDVVHDREENFRIIEEALAGLCCDIVVLPELCLSGYVYAGSKDLYRAAEYVPEGESTERMRKLSERYRCAVVFGVAEKTDRGICNTAVVVDHGRYVGKYQKMHLSDFEKRFFVRGEENRVFSVCGIRIGVQICFDLWFPEMAREQVRLGADLLCVPANFGGESTGKIAEIRALENLTPLVLCNRVGRETSVDMDAFFLGKSAVVAATGERICGGEAEKACSGRGEVTVPPCRANVICGNFMAEMALHDGGHAVLWKDGAPCTRL